MRRLNKIEEECKQYMAAIQVMHRQLQEKRKNEVEFNKELRGTARKQHHKFFSVILRFQPQSEPS